MHPFPSPNNPISLYPFKVKRPEEPYTLAVYTSSPPTPQPTPEWFSPHHFTETVLIKTTMTSEDLLQHTAFWFISLELAEIFARVNHPLLEILPSFTCTGLSCFSSTQCLLYFLCFFPVPLTSKFFYSCLCFWLHLTIFFHPLFLEIWPLFMNLGVSSCWRLL